MTSWQASSEDGPTGPDGALRAIGIAAVCIGVAALTAATFVLSYQGIRAVALQAGIEPRYARGYPLLIDAMLVIVLAAVLALRGAGLPSRMLAWVTLLVVLCAAAGADTLHATGHELPLTTAVVTAAVLPWALVFIAFVLLLAMLRHARLRRQASVALASASWTPAEDDGQAPSQESPTEPLPLPVRSPQPWNSVSIVPGFTSRLVSSAAAGAAAGAVHPDAEPWVQGAAPDVTHAQLAVADREETAVATEPVAQAVAVNAEDEIGVPDYLVSSAEAGTYLPALATEPMLQTDEAEPQTDEAEPQTDEAEPQTDEAEPQTDEAERQTDEAEPLTDEPASTLEAEPRADEAQAQSGQNDDDMPVFRRIRSSPTPPEG